LITESERDYESLILDLATDDQKLALVKDKLIANRLSAPLFDTARYTRNFEEGLLRAYKHHSDGDKPCDLRVD
ncbi:MAG: hypothetical protein P8M13_04775, partial [Luminiphilus sp.]|nr:hypothetical protein [Luminiphilus sp.]